MLPSRQHARNSALEQTGRIRPKGRALAPSRDACRSGNARADNSAGSPPGGFEPPSEMIVPGDGETTFQVLATRGQ